jgi:hypothetical protein
MVAESEDPLQIYIPTLETVTSKYVLKISTSIKTTTAFKGTDPVRSKIAIEVNIIEKINTFNYRDSSISYHNEKDVTVKISKFLQVTGIINRNVNPSPVQKQTRLKYTVFLHCQHFFYSDAKCGQFREQNKCMITSAEIEFMRTA